MLWSILGSPLPFPCYGLNCQVRRVFSSSSSSSFLCGLRQFGSPSLAVPRSFQPGLTCYPCNHSGRTSYRFQDRPEKRTEPILSNGPSKGPEDGAGPVTLQNVAGKIIGYSSCDGSHFNTYSLVVSGSCSFSPNSSAWQRPVRTRHQFHREASRQGHNDLLAPRPTGFGII